MTVLDAFGTRLEAADLLAGIEASGLHPARLILEDGGVALECPDPDITRNDVATALTWLRSKLSPLVPVRLQKGDGSGIADLRTKTIETVFLAEATDPDAGLATVVARLVERLSLQPGTVRVPEIADEFRAQLTRQLTSSIKGAATISVLVPDRDGLRLVGSPTGDGPHFLLWFRPGSEPDVKPAALVAASMSGAAIESLARGLRGEPLSAQPEILLDGLAWKESRQPTIVDSNAPDAATRGSALAHRPGWLSRLAGLPGPSFPSASAPSYLRARPTEAKPHYVLGLAIMTMQEHAAVLLRDGKIVGAIEHERLVRVRHGGWHPPDRPGITAAMDPTIAPEEVFCRRPIRALLEQEGITLDDIDLFAVNGLHGRNANQISFTDASVPIPKIREGRVVYLPHHLCHAASAWRASGFESSWVLTVDGRGDRECAAVWRAENGQLRLVDTLLSLTDRSIGGVYEGVTRLLGFGGHGQGSVMALASFGEPTFDLSRFLSVGSIHESGINEAFAHLRRAPDQPITQDHKNLAASLQLALETTIVDLLRRSVGDGPLDALCLGGGVALNCRMNERLRQTFKPRAMFVQPGANDGGTALGPALEAWADAGGASVAPMTHAYLGPEFSDAEIEPVLRRSGLRFQHVDNIATETAARLHRGEVVCWFQGRMEFGPRALGARSILADPTRPDMHARVNAIKEREAWRPFGPSILAGHEQDWIENAFDARFMLFTMPVKPQQRALVPAIVHVDGTTRPQVVHPETAPAYHALISEFHRLSGVPLVLNTSFNRRGEPIVGTPADAIESFRGLGADALAIGGFIVTQESAARVANAADAVLAKLPGGRRLSLRLTARCDLNCGHCPARDLHGLPDRPRDDVLRSLAEGREAGCDELVILRGEASLLSDLPEIVLAARRMGYRFVQLQTNANALANPSVRNRLLAAGVDWFEVMLLAATEALHDELAAAPGSFRNVLPAIQALAQSQRQLLITVPVVAKNLRQLGPIAALAKKLGGKRIQFNFPRPVELPDRVVTDPVPRLALAALYVKQAAKAARQLGLEVTTEAFPLCLLPPELRTTTDAVQDWTRHRIDDLHVLHESVGTVRPSQRPEPPPCRGCPAKERCPKTWALYLELFGSDELKPLVE